MSLRADFADTSVELGSRQHEAPFHFAASIFHDAHAAMAPHASANHTPGAEEETGSVGRESHSEFEARIHAMHALQARREAHNARDLKHGRATSYFTAQPRDIRLPEGWIMSASGPASSPAMKPNGAIRKDLH